MDEKDDEISTEQLIKDTLEMMYPNKEPGEEIEPLNGYDGH